MFLRQLAQPQLLQMEWQADIAAPRNQLDLVSFVADYVSGMTDWFELAEGGVDLQKLYRTFVKSAIVLFAALVVIWIVNQTEFFQIDSCIDRGGRWLYETAECETTGHRGAELYFLLLSRANGWVKNTLN